jgi:hypothetical protein
MNRRDFFKKALTTCGVGALLPFAGVVLAEEKIDCPASSVAIMFTITDENGRQKQWAGGMMLDATPEVLMSRMKVFGDCTTRSMQRRVAETFNWPEPDAT